MGAMESTECESSPTKTDPLAEHTVMKRIPILDMNPTLDVIDDTGDLSVGLIMKQMDEWLDEPTKEGEQEIIQSIHRLPAEHLNLIGFKNSGILHKVVMKDELSVFLNILLKKRHLDLNVRKDSRMGLSALHLCAMFNRTTVMVELLNDRRCLIDFPAKGGLTALMIAVWKSHIESVLILLKRGAKKELTSESGSTVMTIAIEKGNQRIIDALK